MGDSFCIRAGITYCRNVQSQAERLRVVFSHGISEALGRQEYNVLEITGKGQEHIIWVFGP